MCIVRKGYKEHSGKWKIVFKKFIKCVAGKYYNDTDIEVNSIVLIYVEGYLKGSGIHYWIYVVQEW